MALTPFALMSLIKGCLCTQLAASYGGAVCRCSVYPSPTPPADICTKDANGNGQATVSLSRIFDSKAFPQPDISGTCEAYLAAEINLSVWRCAPTIGDGGELPTVAELEEAARIQSSDAQVLRCAIKCCIPFGYQFILSEYEAYPLDGGCMGGTLTAVVALEPTLCTTVNP